MREPLDQQGIGAIAENVVELPGVERQRAGSLVRMRLAHGQSGGGVDRAGL
jgi:hypothetical protein